MMDYHTTGTFLRAMRCRLFGKSDTSRWADANTFKAEWAERTRLIATLVPKNASVIEFGAGRRLLEQQLDESCRYHPSDLFDRGQGTLVCDLNSRPLPEFHDLNFDVAVLAGVLEYISDSATFIPWLAGQVNVCIASYERARSQPGSLGRLKETLHRAGAGWVNTYTEVELIEAFQGSGFALENYLDWFSNDGTERIFVFRQRSGYAPAA
jgi:hypothetical protein